MVIGCVRRREHPKDTSERVTWPAVTTGDVNSSQKSPLGKILCNFRLRMRTLKGSSDLRSHPVAMLLLYSLYYCTTTKKKEQGKKPGMHRTYFRSGPLPDRASSGHVTSGEKAPLGQILCNFRLHMRRTYFRTGLRSRDFRSRDWHHFRSRHFR